METKQLMKSELFQMIIKSLRSPFGHSIHDAFSDMQDWQILRFALSVKGSNPLCNMGLEKLHHLLLVRVLITKGFLSKMPQ